jgi:hypothetical protein
MTDAFAPAFKMASDAVNEMIKAFIDSYREGGIVAVILDTVAGVCGVAFEAFKAVGEVIGALWDIVKSVFAPLGDLITNVFGVKVPEGGHTVRAVFNDIIDAIEVLAQLFIVGLKTIEGAIKEFAIFNSGAWAAVYDVISGQGMSKAKSDWNAAMAEMSRVGVATADEIRQHWEKARDAMLAFSQDKGPLDGDGKHTDATPKHDAPAVRRNKKPKKEKKEPADKDNAPQTDLEEAKAIAQAKEQIAADDARTTLEIYKSAASDQLHQIERAEKDGTLSHKDAADQRVAITEGVTQAERDAANAQFQAKMTELKAIEDAEIAALKAKQARFASGTTEYINAANQIQAIQITSDAALEVLAVKHQNQLTIINAKGLQDRDKAAQIQTEKEKTYSEQLTNDFSKNIAQMLSGQKSFMGTIQGMWKSLLGVVSSILQQIVDQWLVQHGVMAAIGKIFGLHDVATSAGRAGAAAYASTAAIPIVGPELAPGAAAAAVAGATSFGSIMSASGGWGQVPFDGAMTELHRNEMVLPANLATPLRSMLTSGGANDNSGGAAMPGGGDTHLHIHATDADSVKRLLSSEEGIAGIKAGLRRAGAGLKY